MLRFTGCCNLHDLGYVADSITIVGKSNVVGTLQTKVSGWHPVTMREQGTRVSSFNANPTGSQSCKEYMSFRQKFRMCFGVYEKLRFSKETTARQDSATGTRTRNTTASLAPSSKQGENAFVARQAVVSSAIFQPHRNGRD